MKRLRVGSLMLSTGFVFVMDFLGLVFHYSDQHVLLSLGGSALLLSLISFALSIRKLFWAE